jgi:TonB-linked SusC/RagA family outer membrane protein/phage RecT family recombinase
MTKELIAKFSTTLAQYESKVLTELLAQHGLRPAQFTQIVLTEVKKNPKMLEAFQKNPSSLFASILHCAELGLSPSEMAGEFYFIPYNGIIKPILGYKGLTALMLRNQGVQLIYAETVHRADTFEYELGLEPKLVHKPLDNVRNSSTLTHVYAVAKLSNGEKVFKVMSVQEIMGIMATMKQNNTLYFDDKKDPMMWMPRKTVIKQLAKLLPKDYFGTHAVGIDDRVEGGGYLVLDDDGNVVNKAGDYYFPSNDINRNPVAARELRDIQSKENRSINNMTLTFKPIKDLVIIGTGSLDYMFWRNNEYQKQGIDPNNPGFSNAYRQSLDVFNYNTNLRVNYLKTFAEKHNFSFMAGAEYQDSRTNFFPNQTLNQVATGFLDENNPEVITDGNRRFEEWNFLSYFGRINYNFKNKYYVEVNARQDGSSRFGENNKFGFFPSGSVAWILTEESFLKDNRIVSFLKLKSSYGVNGNSNIPPYAQYALFGQINNAYNGETIIFPNADNPGNPNLKWETSKSFDIGVEYGFLNDRLHGEFNYYRKQSDDILLNVTTQYSTGFGSAWANVGGILNYGMEFALKGNIIDKKFKWNVNFNISRNRNEVTSLGDYTEDAISGGTNDTRLVVGRPIGNNFLVRFSHVDPATGRPVYLDLQGNQTFEWNVDNRVSTGSILPDATGAISNTFRYGRFDLTMEWYFVLGGDIYDSSSKRQLGTFDSDGWNHRTDQFDRWRQPGDDAKYPVLTTTPDTYGSGTPWINTDLWIHDGTYARLRTLSLGYDLPESVIRRLKMKSARIIVTGNNLITLTKFPGLDPEIARDFENATDRNMSPNITYLTAPQQRAFTLTLNVGF